MLLSRLVSSFVFPAQYVGSKLGKIAMFGYSKEYIDSKRELFKNICNGKEITINSSDSVKLNAMFFEKEIKNEIIPKSWSTKILNRFFGKNNTKPSSKIWIMFLGNGGAYEFLGSNQIKRIQKLGFDVLVFNYRSVGKSSGSPSQKGLVEDGKAVIKYASKGYDDIYIHGHSIGGAFATKAVAAIKDENPEIFRKIKLIADRTFASINSVIKTFNMFRGFKWIARKSVDFTDWNIQVTKDWLKIDIKKCLLWAPLDKIVPKKSSLWEKVKKKPYNYNEQSIKLNGYDHNADLQENAMKLLKLFFRI